MRLFFKKYKKAIGTLLLVAGTVSLLFFNIFVGIALYAAGVFVFST